MIAIVLPLAALAVWLEWDAFKLYARTEVESYKRRKLEEAMVKLFRELPEVDEVKVLRLGDDDGRTTGRPAFGEAFYGGKLYEVNTARLTGEEARIFAALWRRQTVSPNGPLCHDPHHAVVFFHDGREVGRAIVCFSCANAAIPASPLGSDLMGFDHRSPEYEQLKREMETLVGSVSRDRG